MNQAYSRLSTTHGHITDCKLLVCMYWTSLVLVRPAASLYSASPSDGGRPSQTSLCTRSEARLASGFHPGTRLPMR